MNFRITVFAWIAVSLTNALAQTPSVDPALDLSRVPPQALARLQPELRAAEASSKNFLPADANPFTASGPITVGEPLSVIPRRHARAATLEAPLQRVSRDGAMTTLIEAGTPLFRWHIPAPDASAVLGYWCGVNGTVAYCFDETATYIATGAVPYAPANVERSFVFSDANPAPAVREIEWASSGLPVLEWIRVFEGWERRRANVSYGLRINGAVYGRRETYYDRRDQNATRMRLQNSGHVIATPGADDRTATIEIIEAEHAYTPNELEVWTRAMVTFLGRPAAENAQSPAAGN
jgi:hypothetical protein